MLTYETSEIQKGLMATRYGQNTCDETQEIITLIQMMSRNKGRKILSSLLQGANSTRKDQKFRDQKLNVVSNAKSNSKTFWKCIESKTSLRPMVTY